MNGEISNGIKTEVVEKIKGLDNQQLTDMVAFVRDLQESAYFDPDGTGDRVQIKVHELTNDNFMKLKDKIENWASGEPTSKR
jgi:hypothetical protein